MNSLRLERLSLNQATLAVVVLRRGPGGTKALTFDYAKVLIILNNVPTISSLADEGKDHETHNPIHDLRYSDPHSGIRRDSILSLRFQMGQNQTRLSPSTARFLTGSVCHHVDVV